MKELKLSTRITTGFVSVLVLMGVTAGWGISSLLSIMANSNEVILADNLRTTLVEREVDHLNWAAKLNEFVYDEHANELNIQTNHTQCALGKWSYGAGRKQVEQHFPSLANDLRAIGEHHRNLHESATRIMDVYVTAEGKLAAFFRLEHGSPVASAPGTDGPPVQLATRRQKVASAGARDEIFNENDFATF